MVKGAEGCSRTGIFNGKPDCKKVSGEGRTYGIFSDHHRRGSGHTQQAGWRNLSEGVCCAWNRSVTDVWRGGFL